MIRIRPSVPTLEQKTLLGMSTTPQFLHKAWGSIMTFHALLAGATQNISLSQQTNHSLSEDLYFEIVNISLSLCLLL